jgi:2-methylcitrate dehydratase PrpD
MTVAHTLASFACESTRLTSAARAASVRAAGDLVAAPIAGSSTRGGIAALNAAVASMLDLDDGHRAAPGHPGAAAIPAALAAAESHGADADAERVLAAIAIGYEVGVRIAGARDVGTLHTFDSGLWCGQGQRAGAGAPRRNRLIMAPGGNRGNDEDGRATA